MDGPLYAYIVTEKEGGEGDVFFAHSSAEALQMGADGLNYGETYGVECRRAPEFDGKQGDQRAITRHLLDDGWRFECAGFGIVTADDAPFVDQAGDVYRTPYHWLSWVEERIISQAAEREFRDWATSKWWFADDLRTSVDGKGMHSVELWLPHLRYSVKWSTEKPDVAYVCPSDLLTWRRLYGNCFVGLADQLPRFRGKMGI